MNLSLEQTINYLKNNEEERNAFLAGTVSLLNFTKEETLQIIRVIRDHNKVTISKFWY
jgi:hypothetical protein